ncbi:methyltransferase domain-containing protein [Planobispora longispora]|uniref:RNA methyltransferase n=1 Tax=Planobispora longispora TaxID=28887 RepID=A0A8J3RNC4_9ACTN|nr:methyltransferase domain-containing protein [Planobispora longispora]BFE79576.1 methyltransferase domain-containing protein [Planobispora longispora]GIH78119.1 RNA methyltransferase [Planobispora longispora]
MTAASLVARCVHGLEPTVAAEILQRGLGVVTRLGHREVHFRAPRSGVGAAVTLRTADDVFLLAARCAETGTARRDAAALALLADLADPGPLARLRRDHGGPGALTGVEVSASFLGRRNFTRYDVEDAVGHALARRLGTGYHSRRTGTAPPPGHSGWRVTLDGEHATLLLRIAERPLHRRDYKRRSVPGTLHPPLAAAMAQMAGIRPGHTVLDPCCGAGTLLIEAGAQQPQARLHGFDLDPRAVHAAAENAAGLPVALARADAGRLPLPDGGVDRVLSNPPWGGQVSARGLLAASFARWWAELGRVLAPGGTAVVLLPDPGHLPAGPGSGLEPAHLQRVRVSGAPSFLLQLTAPGGRDRHRRTTLPRSSTSSAVSSSNHRPPVAR